jgi:hypothetical protein
MKASGLAKVFAIGVVALAAVGCDDSDEGGGDTMKFIGTWMYTSGTSTSNCGGTSETEQLTGNVTIQKGVSSPLVSVDEGCSIALDVNGNTAQSRPGQECSQTEQGVQLTFKITAYTFTVNGVVADESGSGQISATGPGGSINCNLTSTGRLTKLSQ